MSELASAKPALFMRERRGQHVLRDECAMREVSVAAITLTFIDERQHSVARR